jgi:hypothetical protein
MDDNYETITVKYKNFFKINNNNSSEKVDLDNIDININTSQSSQKSNKSSNHEPNFLVLTVLWSYFNACQQGILDKDNPAPWEQIEVEEDNLKEEKKFNYQKWLAFLNNIVDDNWTDWIKNSQKLKKKALWAYNKLKDDTNNSVNQGENIDNKKSDMKEDIKNKIKEKLECVNLNSQKHSNINREEIANQIRKKVLEFLKSQSIL